MMADDYTKARSFLNEELQNACSKQDMRREFHWSGSEDALITLATSETDEDLNEAHVTINISEFSDPSPFGGTHSTTETYHLSKTEAGWRFSEYPWPLEFCESSGSRLPQPMTQWVLRG
jgi:hypothetical protein